MKGTRNLVLQKDTVSLWVTFFEKKERHFQEISEKSHLKLGESMGRFVVFLFLFGELPYPRWWFQTFFVFTPIWGNDPN